MKLISLRVNEKLLNEISGDKSQFIREAIYEKLYGDAVQINMITELEHEVVKKFHKVVSKYHDDSAHSLLYRMFGGQCSSSKKRGHAQPKYTRTAFIEHWLNDPTFIKLYEKYKKSGFKNNLRPSVDRLNNDKGYSFKNTQILSWGDHLKKSANTNQVGYGMRISVEGVEYPSLSAAGRDVFNNKNTASTLGQLLKESNEVVFMGKKVKRLIKL